MKNSKFDQGSFDTVVRDLFNEWIVSVQVAKLWFDVDDNCWRFRVVVSLLWPNKAFEFEGIFMNGGITMNQVKFRDLRLKRKEERTFDER